MADEFQHFQVLRHANHPQEKQNRRIIQFGRHASYNLGDSTLEKIINHTYLGVELNNKLSWASHIQKATSKANCILSLLRRNLYSCSSKVKERAYKTLVRPRLEYCSAIWDPPTKISWKGFNCDLPDSSLTITIEKIASATWYHNSTGNNLNTGGPSNACHSFTNPFTSLLP